MLLFMNSKEGGLGFCKSPIFYLSLKVVYLLKEGKPQGLE